MIKKIISLFLCALSALSLTACGGKTAQAGSHGTASSAEASNPFVGCSTLAEAEQVAGFSLTAPEQVSEKTAARLIRAMKGRMIELIYQDGAGDEQARVRKAQGEEDISGDYTEYEEQSSVAVGDVHVTMKGSGGSVNAAIWTQDGASFSVTSPAGLSRDAMAALIQTVQ